MLSNRKNRNRVSADGAAAAGLSMLILYLTLFIVCSITLGYISTKGYCWAIRNSTLLSHIPHSIAQTLTFGIYGMIRYVNIPAAPMLASQFRMKV